MRKMMLLAAMVAMAALMMAAAPAMADDNNGDGRDDDFCDVFDCDDDFCDIFDCDDDFCDIFDCDDDNNNNDDNFCDFFNCRDDNNNNVVPAITQDFEQEAESGDVDQSFDVSGTGHNSNQTVGIQGVANTGNAQNQIGVIDAGGFSDFDGNDDDFCDIFDCDDDNNNNDDNFCDFFNCRDDNNDGFFFLANDFDNDFDNDGDFELENVGSTIELSPTNTTSSDQQVNQAAAAFGK